MSAASIGWLFRTGVVLLHVGAADPVAGEEPVAGLRPSQRPAGAPVIHEMQKEGQWYREALTGVLPPYPYSLKFLEDQGAWSTPFNRPGMTGRYDIRGWHGR